MVDHTQTTRTNDNPTQRAGAGFLAASVFLSLSGLFMEDGRGNKSNPLKTASGIFGILSAVTFMVKKRPEHSKIKEVLDAFDAEYEAIIAPDREITDISMADADKEPDLRDMSTFDRAKHTLQKNAEIIGSCFAGLSAALNYASGWSRGMSWDKYNSVANVVGFGWNAAATMYNDGKARDSALENESSTTPPQKTGTLFESAIENPSHVAAGASASASALGFFAGIQDFLNPKNRIAGLFEMLGYGTAMAFGDTNLYKASQAQKSDREIEKIDLKALLPEIQAIIRKHDRRTTPLLDDTKLENISSYMAQKTGLPQDEVLSELQQHMQASTHAKPATSI